MLEHIEINLHFHSKVMLNHGCLLLAKVTETIGRCKKAGVGTKAQFFVNITSGGIISVESFPIVQYVSEDVSVSVIRQKDGRYRLCEFRYKVSPCSEQRHLRVDLSSGYFKGRRQVNV
jgi:hypothetical protein